MEHTNYTPDWRDIDPIYNFVAIDADGEIWAYEKNPSKSEIYLLWWNCVGVLAYIIGTTTPPTDFTKCIYERPQTQTP
jgi:hypothetical protein